MLILTRRVGETLIIGEGEDAIHVTATGINESGGQVKLGITAPRHIPVHREEVYDRIQAGKQQLAKAS